MKQISLHILQVASQPEDLVKAKTIQYIKLFIYFMTVRQD